jgi:sugar O-acyltransferase (sialic acid O-acetyltransferase NeuD family)
VLPFDLVAGARDTGPVAPTSTQNPLFVIGAGGHAKVVIATAQSMLMPYVDDDGNRGSQSIWPEIRVCDDNAATHGRQVLGFTVEGASASVLSNPLVSAVLAIGNNAGRAQLAAAARCRFATLVHHQAILHASVRIGVGSVVFAGAIIQPDTVIGALAIINTGASVDHDCVLGDAVHIAPGARLAGGVTVGARSFIGIGAVVAPGITIGDDVIIGAGAAVVRDIPSGTTAVGVPARALTPRERF